MVLMLLLLRMSCSSKNLFQISIIIAKVSSELEKTSAPHLPNNQCVTSREASVMLDDECQKAVGGNWEETFQSHISSFCADRG